jgi:ribosome-associated protein
MTSKELAKKIAELLSAKKAENIKILNLSGMSDIADYFVVASCRSAPQVKAAYEHIEAELEKQGTFARRKEGITEGRWIAIDYIDVVVHIFHAEARAVYSIDTLWSKGDNVEDFVD